AQNLIGDVEGRDILIMDDEIDTGGTILSATDIVLSHGARSVSVACVHPILSGNAVQRICGSGKIEELLVTDSIPIGPEKMDDRITVLSIAPLFSEAISRIHSGQSVGALFSQKSPA